MNQIKFILIGLIALGCIGAGSANIEKIINCYWGTWANYRQGFGGFKTDQIDPKLCTHLSYTFEGIDANGEIKVLDTWLDLPSGLNNIAKAMALKTKNPKLKVILVVGGWNEGSAKYSQMAADPAKRKRFVQSVVNFMLEHKFDGFDLDWEYPARREGASPNDKANFVTLLKELSQAMKAHGWSLSIAVGASPETALISYDVPNMVKYLDFINVMTYDFVTGESSVVGYNAPLRGQGSNNVESSMKWWLSQGVPSHKIVMGLAFYGHHFRLANPAEYRLGARTAGAGGAGPHTQTPGFLGYNEICTTIKSYNYEWAEQEQVPILYNKEQVISYDDAKSIALKVKLANKLNLGGVMVWSIETDDFHGLCGTKFVLLKTINNEMGKKQDMSTEKPVVLEPAHPQPPQQTYQPNQPGGSNGSGDCSQDGLIRHKSDCTKFVHCLRGLSYEKDCPAGLHFNAAAGICDWPASANCQ